LQARLHADNAATLHELAAKLDRHAATVAAIRPAVAALEVSRSKLATFGFHRFRRRGGAGLDCGRRSEVDYWLDALAFSIRWCGADALVRDVN